MSDPPIFPRYLKTYDGKELLFELCQSFADEFNTESKNYLLTTFGQDRLNRFQPLKVTSAYPTTQQQMPQICIVRNSMTPQPGGLGYVLEEKQIQLDGQPIKFNQVLGEVVTDSLEVTLCCINPNLRDDLFKWFRQYMIDAIANTLTTLNYLGVYDLRCVNAADDQVEYQGGAGQPGFQFYVARCEYEMRYDLGVVQDVDAIASIINWQNLYPELPGYAGTAGAIPDAPVPPDPLFTP